MGARRVGRSLSSNSTQSDSSHHNAQHHDGRIRERRTRKKRKRPNQISDFEVWKRAILLWVIGIVLIECFFFYKSIAILDAIGGRHLFDNANNGLDEKGRPPMPRHPPPPKASLLPKRVITIFGPESSGTTFLSTTLGVAVGAFTEHGGWWHIPPWAFSHTVPDESKKGHRIYRQRNPTGRWRYEKDISRRAMTSDGEWEIQHVSLPWGWQCEEDEEIPIVEALVPEECFRYAIDPHLHYKTAEALWHSTKKESRHVYEEMVADVDANATLNGEGSDSDASEKAKLAARCREEARISQEDDGFTCGAQCGRGKYNGLALYPQRFSVNISSHIEWYKSRGVDITVILSMRDRSISSRGKLKGHCQILDVGIKEDEVALNLMSEAMQKYGKRDGDMSEKNHLITVSYEGMMEMQEAYLQQLYHQLGINSSYTPNFVDGNSKYLVDISAQKKQSHVHHDKPNRPPKPKSYVAPPAKKSLLPKKVITIFGPESSGTKFLSSTLGSAVGAFPKEGEWSHVDFPSGSSLAEEWVYHEHNYRRATTKDGEWEVQHISLPNGWLCEEGSGSNIVEALVSAECFRYESHPELSPEAAEKMFHIEKDKRRRAALAPRRRHNIPRFSETNGAEAVDLNDRKRLLDAAVDTEFAERCRNEVHIAEEGSTWTCGAKCGSEKFDGFALYPKRFFVNITSHIEWYHQRGVDITVILSLRDRSISRMSKLRDHCYVPSQAVEEDELAVSLMKEALSKYGNHHRLGKPTLISVSYEGLMQFKEAYLFSLYHKLGIKSSHSPTFSGGNEKYVREVEEYLPQELPTQKRNKPRFLPKRVIAVFGPESSGTTFLASTLGLAVGIPEGTNMNRQAMSPDGRVTLQHLSLPLGWECEEGEEMNVVESLVPDECLRYARDPSIESRTAVDIFWKHRQAKPGQRHQPQTPKILDADEEARILSKCREEVRISQEDDGFTCGAQCGTDQFSGFALYPLRFSVNITSHVEWYIQRNIDVKVVVSLRDRTISSKGKLKGHCHLEYVGRREDEVALTLMSEAIEKYGKRGSRRGSLPEDVDASQRVFAVSYEGLMKMEEVYLFNLYKELGINSTHVPSFKDGNEKYITSANVANLGEQELEHEQQQRKRKLDLRPPKPQSYQPPPPKENLLPKRLITVVGSSMLSTTIAVAMGAFPRNSRWVEREELSSLDAGADNEGSKDPHELVFEESVRGAVTSTNGDFQIQHIALPAGDRKCNTVYHTPAIVEALVPKECSRTEKTLTATPNDPKIAEKCRGEVHIENDSTSWTCGAKCGTEEHNGYAIYPERYFVNISSHVDWYQQRGVDVTVVMLLRDSSILLKERLKEDCSRLEIAKKEDETALKIIKEAYEKYGSHGSHLKIGEKERVIAVSYEGLLELRDVYLFDLYYQLGINSTYFPSGLIDENAKYITDPSKKNATLGMRHRKKAKPLHFLPGG